MTVLALFGYAALLSLAGAWALRRARWVDRSPRLGIAVWQGLSLATVLAVLLGALVLVVPTAHVTADLAVLLRTCALVLRARYATPGGAVAGSVGAALAVAVTVRLTQALVVACVSNVRQRHAQRRMLALVGRRDAGLDAFVIDHDAVAAYCLPGWRARVVLTRGALRLLDESQLGAVLAHERAHLRARHDLALALPVVLSRAFPFVPAFGWAQAETARLVELAADDAAARRWSRPVVAAALLALAEAGVPVTALGAGGPGTPARVRRLLAPAPPVGSLPLVAAALALAGGLVVPFALAAGPAVSAWTLAYCPVPLPL